MSLRLSFICSIEDKEAKNEATARSTKISLAIEDRSKAKINTRLDPKIIILATNAILKRSHCSNFIIIVFLMREFKLPRFLIKLLIISKTCKPPG